MVSDPIFLGLVRSAAVRDVLFLPHALHQTLRPDRMISAEDVRRVVETGEIIEDYPEDPRRHSCLLFGMSRERPIHVVFAPKENFLAIITAYLPEPSAWSKDFKARLSK